MAISRIDRVSSAAYIARAVLAPLPQHAENILDGFRAHYVAGGGELASNLIATARDHGTT